MPTGLRTLTGFRTVSQIVTRRAASSAVATSHDDGHSHDDGSVWRSVRHLTILRSTSRPPIVVGEPGPGFIQPASARDWERDPQLAALNYPQMQGPLWSYSHFLRPWRRDRYWPAERVQFGETLHESEDVLGTMSSDPYTNFRWRNFVVFYSGVAVVLGSVAMFANFLVNQRSPWTRRQVGDTEAIIAELKDTGRDEEEDE